MRNWGSQNCWLQGPPQRLSEVAAVPGSPLQVGGLCCWQQAEVGGADGRSLGEWACARWVDLLPPAFSADLLEPRESPGGSHCALLTVSVP